MAFALTELPRIARKVSPRITSRNITKVRVYAVGKYSLNYFDSCMKLISLASDKDNNMRFAAPMASENSLDATQIAATDSLKIARQARQKSFQARQKVATGALKDNQKLTALATRKCLPIDISKPPPAPKMGRFRKLTPEERAAARARFSTCWTPEQLQAVREEMQKGPTRTKDSIFTRGIRRAFKATNDAQSAYLTPPSSGSDSDSDDSMEVVTPPDSDSDLPPDHEIEALLNAEPEQHYKYEPHEVKHHFSSPELAERHKKAAQESLKRRYGLYRTAMAREGITVPENPPDIPAMREWEHEVNRQAVRRCNVARHRHFVLMQYPHYARKLAERNRKQEEDKENLRMERVASELIQQYSVRDRMYQQSLERMPSGLCPPSAANEFRRVNGGSFTSQLEVDEVDSMLPQVLASQLTLTQEHFQALQGQKISRTSEMSVESLLRPLTSQSTISPSDFSPQPRSHIHMHGPEPAPPPPTISESRLRDPEDIARIKYYDTFFQFPPAPPTLTLDFATMPWPLLAVPSHPSDINPSTILSFLQTSVNLFMPPPSITDSFISDFSYTPSERSEAMRNAAEARAEREREYPGIDLGAMSEDERVAFHVREVANTERDKWEGHVVEETMLRFVADGDKEAVRQGARRVFQALCAIGQGRNF